MAEQRILNPRVAGSSPARGILKIMLFFFYLLSIGNQPFVRISEKTSPPVINTTKIWVFFTDKGIFNESQYQTALSTFEKNAPLEQRQRRAAGFDFDDLPVHQTYIQKILSLGACLRSVSNWLNAISIEAPLELIPEIYRLPFVYDIKPVGSRTERIPETAVLIHQPESPRRLRRIDTAGMHRLYGTSWDQAEMLGVPEVSFRGYYGSGVKLALFDTGIKLKHQAVKGLRITQQYDFISGDNFFVFRDNLPPQPINTLRYLGLVKDPVLTTAQSNLILTFVADSFNYLYGRPTRALFMAHSSDKGVNWSKPTPLLIARSYSYTYENLKLLSQDSITYFTFNEVELHPGAPATCYLGYFLGTTYQGQQTVGSGSSPTLALWQDTLYLSYIGSDTNITLIKFSLSQLPPTRVVSHLVPSPERITEPQITVAPNGQINLFARGINSGRVFHFQSQDGGINFTSLTDIAFSGTRRLRLFAHPQAESIKLLLYLDENDSPFTKLVIRISTDYGATWQPPRVIDSALTIGDYTLCLSQKIKLIYESSGFLYQKSSSDCGQTWQNEGIIDPTGFCYSPNIASLNNSFISVWYKRGDETAIWEEADTLKFSQEQPYHGTRMASIIAGYQPYSFMGIAPAVDLLIARTEFYQTAGNRYYEYNMEEDTYIQALEWAERNGTDVVSTSLGYRDWLKDDQFDGKTAPVSIAASLAAKRGMLIVTAMGNRDTTIHPWPKPYIVAPGDADGVITCGGVEKNLLPWRGTGTGPTADGRIKPDLVALADTVAVVAPETENSFEGSAGTSCATALIAGCCALLKEAHPQWDAESIKAVLFSTATRSVKSCTFGFGVPRIDSAFKLFPPETQSAPFYQNQIATIFPNPFITSQHPKVFFGINITRVTPKASIYIYTPDGTLTDIILLDESKMPTPGRYQDKETLEKIGAYWDGKNLKGEPVASGLYLAVLNTTFGSAVAKFTLIRAPSFPR